MGRAVQLRDDYDGDELRRLARHCRDSDQTRRLLALAVIYDGGSRTAAAKTGGVTLQIVRDWVLRFNADGPESLKNRWGGRPEAQTDGGASSCARRDGGARAGPCDPRRRALATL